MAKRRLKSVPAIQEPRTLQAVNQEFGNVCAEIGFREHQIAKLRKDQAVLEEKLGALDIEADRSKSYYEKKEAAHNADALKRAQQ